MNSIKENVTYRQEIDKSVFITELIRVKSVEEISENIEKIKEKYKDATHYCYAYIIDDRKKSSDDGEPGGTAGVPIMEVLLKNDLNYILCIVIRFFGGIKLGSGGLVRAYSSSTSNAIKIAKIVNLIDGYKISFDINYNEQSKIEYLIKNSTYTKNYNELVNYKVIISKNELYKLDDLNIKYKIINKQKIEE